VRDIYRERNRTIPNKTYERLKLSPSKHNEDITQTSVSARKEEAQKQDYKETDAKRGEGNKTKENIRRPSKNERYSEFCPTNPFRAHFIHRQKKARAEIMVYYLQMPARNSPSSEERKSKKTKRHRNTVHLSSEKEVTRERLILQCLAVVKKIPVSVVKNMQAPFGRA
jgi:hypothetical protein